MCKNGKRKPTGFVAICQCDETIGAIDYNNTGKKDTGRLLGKWLEEGCSIVPKFEGTWTAIISNCKCK